MGGDDEACFGLIRDLTRGGRATRFISCSNKRLANDRLKHRLFTFRVGLMALATLGGTFTTCSYKETNVLEWRLKKKKQLTHLLECHGS